MFLDPATYEADIEFFRKQSVRDYILFYINKFLVLKIAVIF